MMTRCRLPGAFLLALLVMVLVAAPEAASASGMAAPSHARPRSHPRAAPITNVQLQVEGGYSTYYRPGAWVPVRARISNQGPTFTGVLSIADTGGQSTNAAPANVTSYSRSVVMPQGGVKEVTLYVPAADVGSSLAVSLTAGKQVVAVRQAPLTSLSNSTLLVGVLSGNAATETQLRAVARQIGALQVVTTKLDAARLDPQPLALANLDAIVVNAFTSAVLSSDQRRALETWVRAGGTLIIVGGPTAQATLSGLPSAVQIAQPGQPLILHGLPALGAMGGPLPAGDLLAAVGKPAGSIVLLDTHGVRTSTAVTSAGSALLTERPLGQGAVLYSAIDPTLAPLASWVGLPRLWSLLLSPARAGAVTAVTTLAGTQQNLTRNDTLDAEIDNVSPPSITLFVILLGVYVVLLVPLNFIVLGRLRRRDWSWITLPSLALILVAATFGSAYASRGSNVRTSVVSVVYLTSGSDQAVAQSYVGLFSPLAGDYTITPADTNTLGSVLFTPSQGNQSGSASPLAVNFSQDTGAATLPNLAMWSARNAMFAGVIPFHQGLESTVRVTAAGRLMVSLHNPTSTFWHSVIVVPFGGAPQALGDVPPGATVAATVPTGTAAQNTGTLGDFYGQTSALLPHPSDYAGPAIASLRLASGPLIDVAEHLFAGDSIPTNPGEALSDRFQHIVDQIFGNNNPALLGSIVVLGWSADPLLAFSVNGSSAARQDTTLLVQAIPVQLAPGHFTLNAGTIPARLVGSDQDLSQGYGSTGFSIGSNSSATFLGQVPLPAPGHQLIVTSLTLTVASSGAGGALDSQTAAIFDWRTGLWSPVDVSNGQVDILKAGRFVNAAGQVRVRLSAQDSTLGVNDPATGVLLGATGSVR